MGLNKKYVEHPLIWPETVEARLYQQTIAEKACQKNTMVILPTALGKTVISTLAAAHFIYNHWNMKILIMAPTRPLVLQHKDTFSKFLKIKAEDMAVLTGKVPPSYRRFLWEGDAKVFFATPQVVRNDLESGRFSLENFSFVVFDECHRARKNYAYTLVAKKYVEQARWPVIMATTASPGSNQKNIHQTCSDLYIEQIEFRTEEDPDVEPYIYRVDVEWKQVDLPREYKEMGGILRDILWERLRRLQFLGVVKKYLNYVNRRDLLEAGESLRKLLEDASETEKGPLYGAIMLQAASLTTFHALELLETQGTYSLSRFLERVERNGHQKKSYRNIINDPSYRLLRNYLAKIGGLNHPKVLALKEEVSRHLGSNPSTRILVFTQYRDTATHLVSELKALNGVYVKRFVGQASKEDDPGLSQDEQAQILHDFREGKLNILVATSIAEEGLDIPVVDLVIFYEPVPSEIRYIQRKGRTGRKSIGKTVILAAKETYDIAYLYASKRRVEKMKGIVASLTKQLKLFTRRGVKPAFNPIPESEIAEEKPFTLPQKVVEKIEVEVEKVKEFTKEVNRAAKRLWTKAMKAGARGLLIEDLLEELALEGYSPSIVNAAINHLEEADQIHKMGWDRIASVASMSKADEKEDKDLYEVEVEKVLPGKAICIINNKWRARLVPEEYEGPPNLIKKNMKFRARITLYHEGKNLHIQVRKVTEIL
ncbi:MAG: helicase-related protein [Candidatus Bathyarchaeota archaeon]|nr:helicase-related protein [Candidatus Bathyarchaeota archaeon]MDH5623450.1 helicase-related protein [Candidatus Bathyarchaeota archaeon]